MAEYMIQDTTLDAIADAINAKTGGSSSMTPAQMVTEIGTISGGGTPQVRNWKAILGTVTQATQSSSVTIDTGIANGTLISFIAYLADGVESLPEFPEGVTSQITGHAYTRFMDASYNMSLYRTSGGANSNYVTGATCSLNASGRISFGNTRGSQSVPNTTYKYVAVIEVTT